MEVDQFHEEVKICLCESEDFMNSTCLFKCETIEFIQEWNIDEHNLGDIQDLFGSIAKGVFVKKAEESTLTCYAPQNIMDILLMDAERNLDELIKMDLIKLTLRYHIVLTDILEIRYKK